MTHRITIEYEVTTCFQVVVERDELPATHDQLLESVTRDELSGSLDTLPIEWGHVKDAWRSATPENTWVFDENNDPLFPCDAHY
jgi:hypothetical protein